MRLRSSTSFVLINSGDIASALWSLVIAVRTWFLLAGGEKWRCWATEKSCTGKGGWLLCLGLIHSPLYRTYRDIRHRKTPSQRRAILCLLSFRFGLMLDNSIGTDRCWIGKEYPPERVFFHYGNSQLFN